MTKTRTQRVKVGELAVVVSEVPYGTTLKKLDEATVKKIMDEVTNEAFAECKNCGQKLVGVAGTLRKILLKHFKDWGGLPYFFYCGECGNLYLLMIDEHTNKPRLDEIRLVKAKNILCHLCEKPIPSCHCHDKVKMQRRNSPRHKK